MRKSWLTLGALLLLATALGVFVWLKPPKTQGDAAIQAGHKPAQVQSLSIERDGKPLAALRKADGHWQVVSPLKVPADDFQVARLLAILEARSASRYPPDLARFELEKPRATLVIDGERYAFGAINTVTREQYVLVNGAVFAVDGRYGAAVPAEAAALAQRTLFAPGDTPVKFEMGSYTIIQDAKKWNIVPPAELSQDNTNGWVAQWREGGALQVEAAQAVNGQPLTRELAITLKDGRRITIGVVATAPELVLRRADLGLQFTYTGDVGRRMLAPPPLQSSQPAQP